jgi:hypothetical protein
MQAGVASAASELPGFGASGRIVADLDEDAKLGKYLDKRREIAISRRDYYRPRELAREPARLEQMDGIPGVYASAVLSGRRCDVRHADLKSTLPKLWDLDAPGRNPGHDLLLCVRRIRHVEGGVRTLISANKLVKSAIELHERERREIKFAVTGNQHLDIAVRRLIL